MKRFTTLSLAFLLTVSILSLASPDSTATAQQEVKKIFADTGIVRLAPGQRLRVSAAQTGDGQILGNLLTAVRFKRMRYIEQDNIYKVASQTTTPSITLPPNEGAFIESEAVVDAADYVLWRIVVVSNRRNVQATATIIDTETGKTTTHIIMANTEGDFH